jgi:hypothetical protein
MVAVELLLGAIFTIVSVSAFWFALPRDGEVRGYLRNEQVQAYYTVALVVGFVVGVGSLVLGFADMIR